MVWCPDWPVVAAWLATGIPRGEPVPATAIVTANHVVACSVQARSEGIRRGMRRREAQSRCPDLVVLARDEPAEVRCFEPAILAVEAVVAGVEVLRPGLMAVGAAGPARYFGGEAEFVETLYETVHATVDTVAVGVADGAFAAEQAARRELIVPPGQSAAFLAALPVSTLDGFGGSALVDVLQRLGIRTLGAFAALPAKDVAARFGPVGSWAHRQAGGRDDRPLVAREPPAECVATVDFEPAAERVDVVAFTARTAVETFIADLAARELACTCVEVEVSTENGEHQVRRWRQTGVLTASDVIDRIRWQIEGWLHGQGTVLQDTRYGGRGDGLPTAGICRLRIAPVEVVPTGTHQQALWGGDGEAGARANRALARVQTMLGLGGVVRPVVTGGRSPAQRTEWVPWGLDTQRLDTQRLEAQREERAQRRSADEPWPGRLPSPAPSVVLDPPRPVQLLDQSGHPVVIGERGSIARPPARLGLGNSSPVPVVSWAGPWPADERWWDPACATRVARVQLVDTLGRAYLVAGEMTDGRAPRWFLEGVYD
jgi:protein ImuB